MKKGLLIILSGPSGVGKGTIRDKIMDDEKLKLAFSVSMTSRAPRVGEIDGVHYYFVTRDQFEQAIKEEKLLEYSQFVGNYYGTPAEAVEKLRNEGKNVLLEIEVEGARCVMKKCPDALSIFILPPSMEELENRIRGRRSEEESVIQKRLAKAKGELEAAKEYKYNVINDNIDVATKQIKDIILENMK